MTTIIKYQIYRITEDGLLKEPTRQGYGNPEALFSEYDSMDEAVKAIEEYAMNNGDYAGPYRIIPEINVINF